MASVRWEEIAGALRLSIQNGTLTVGGRLPSETALAEEWRVCRMTAHRALSELQREGLVARRRRVGTIVLAPGKTESALVPAQPPRFKTAHRSRTAKNVGLLFFHTNDFPQVEYVHGFRSGLRDEHHLLFCDSRNTADCEAQFLVALAHDADALCCYPTGDKETTEMLARIAASGTPVVCLDRLPGELSVDGIVTDNYHSTQEALRFLIRQRGHQRIGFLTTARDGVSSITDRRKGFVDTLREAGEPDGESLVRALPVGLGYDFDRFAQAILEAIQSLRALPDPPTALFCLEDYFLAAALEACDALNLRIPGDMEILSFSDCPPLAARLTKSVHRVRQQAFLMGQMAAQKLQKRMDGDVSPVDVVRLPALLHPAAFITPADAPARRLIV